MVYVVFLACLSPEINKDSAQMDVFSPRSESIEIELGVGDEKRWLFEGAVEQEENEDGSVGIEVVFGTTQADAQVDITLFDGMSMDEILFEDQLVSESGAIFKNQIPCDPTCSFRYVSKAIHSGGTDNTLLKLIFRLDQTEGNLLISALQ
ncbi:MAG: hypothetical protein CMK59_04310 [Proteobacteria bacterium]|nr:hypothetical protein [Pseudomonadota bacterium]